MKCPVEFYSGAQTSNLQKFGAIHAYMYTSRFIDLFRSLLMDVMDTFHEIEEKEF